MPLRGRAGAGFAGFAGFAVRLTVIGRPARFRASNPATKDIESAAFSCAETSRDAFDFCVGNASPRASKANKSPRHSRLEDP